MLALEWGGKDYAWASWPIISMFAISLVVGLLFIVVELRAEEPVLPLNLFKNRMVVGLSLACLCQGAIMFSAIAYLPIFSTAVLGQENSNGLLTPMMASLIAGAVAFGFLQSKFAYRTLIAVSMVAGVIVSYLLTTVGHDASKWYMMGLMVLLGLGAVGPLMSLAQTAMAASVERKYIGVTSSIVGFWRSIGGVLGASIMATVVNSNLKTILTDGAAAHQIPLDQIGTLASPELLVRATGTVPKEILDFVRDSLGTAINHGFILCIVFAVIGIIAAVVAGPGRYTNPVDATAKQPAHVG
ncbi:Multidrug resistance protein 3 [compost metagenome]